MLNSRRIVLVVFLVQAAAQQPPRGSIEGRILTASGNTLARTTVTLFGPAAIPQMPLSTTAQKGVSSATFTTDENGKFSFGSLQPGIYRLAATRNGFTTVEYGQHGPNGTGIPIIIKSGQNQKDVTITLFQKGAVSGRILDRNGLPAVRSTVQALQYQYQDRIQRRQLTAVQATTTDDEGNFRLFSLPPGAYIISASNSGILITSTASFTFVSAGTRADIIRVPKSDGSFEEQVSVMSYFPGTTAEDQATVVHVHDGETLNGINFSQIYVPSHRIRGFVKIASTSIPLTSIQLLSKKSIGQSQYIQVDSNDGTFEVGGITSGEYLLNGQPVLVGDKDIENLEVRPFPNQIHGTITIESSIDGERIPNGFSHFFTAVGKNFGFSTAAIASADGTYRMPVVPDDYVLIMDGDPARNPQYLKSARFGNQDALDVFHVDGNEGTTLNVVLASRKGSVSGQVFDSRHQPDGGANVVLIPEQSRQHRSDMYVSVTSDAEGKFQFNAVPGSYKIFAWEDIEKGSWMDSQFISKIEDRGQTVRVDESGKETVTLTVIPYMP